MDQKPFDRLTEPRAVNRPEWPADLAEFYRWHEGVGLDASCDRAIRLCRLDEVASFGWSDVASADVPEGWERFAALEIGLGTCGERIVYVLHAPSCLPGSIMAVGTILVGCEGGTGPNRIDGSLVLGASFAGWLDHLERWNWEEPIIAGMGDLSPANWELARRYYAELNGDARNWAPRTDEA